MSALAITTTISPVFFETNFKKAAISALSKIFQETLGATSETTITYKSESFKVSIGAIILLNGVETDTYSMWDYSAAALSCFQTSDPPITEVKILSILCNDVYIQTSKYDPFKGHSKPGRYAI